MTRGLYLGKFMPVHNGHLFVIDVASRLVDELTVLVCSTTSEPIDGRLRVQWVRGSVGEGVLVEELHEDLPQLPEDHKDFWAIWRNAIHDFGDFDKVFGGEDYVVKLGEEIGAVPVPLGRETVNISATMVRSNPRGHWFDIPPAVRPYFQRRVTLLGPESSGKSTLSAALARKYNHSGRFRSLMCEYGRIYDTSLKQGKDWTCQDFQVLANTHVSMREALSPYAGPLLVEDTDELQTMAWEQTLMGVVNDDDYVLQNPADLYLLLSPEVPWIDDGTRYDEAFRGKMFSFLKDQLMKRQLPFVVIEGSDWLAREAAAFNVVADFESCKGHKKNGGNNL